MYGKSDAFGVQTNGGAEDEIGLGLENGQLHTAVDQCPKVARRDDVDKGRR